MKEGQGPIRQERGEETAMEETAREETPERDSLEPEEEGEETLTGQEDGVEVAEVVPREVPERLGEGKEESLFLHHLLPEDKPDILLVQEVLLSSQELLLKVKPYGYNCESNIDVLNPTKPGTAVIWREGVPVAETRVIVEGRLQLECHSRLGDLSQHVRSER